MGVGTLLANVTLLILSIMQFTQFICSHDMITLCVVRSNAVTVSELYMHWVYVCYVTRSRLQIDAITLR